MTTKPISKILVANRGEIACRVFATARRLGIATVAVHSDADAGLPFVIEADQSVRLPGNTPAETYLRTDLILAAAQATGADAIHPGYGFLSENADFARAVIAAGITWIGPSPESIDAMGSKVAAKAMMAAAGVPILTSIDPAQATAADLPLLVKASAGGGGRGMRIVRDLAALPDEVALASNEAASAFGDGTVFVEPYVERGRHVEVQVWGDHGGTNVSVLGARDCSIQRRHQKVVEEAPPPGLSADTLEAMYDAARKAAGAINYVGAGTVEFLVDATDTSRFYFLEMNTRLQVEHPVTEAVMGVDLVELQIAAASDPTVLGVHSSGPDGHSIEVRLYAEDPARDWQPQSGSISRLSVPDVDVEFGRLQRHGVRLDSGFVTGSEVGTHYDAMISKVIVWAPTREQAALRLAGVLERTEIHGLTTNRDLLVRILHDPDFIAGRVSTDFFDAHPTITAEAQIDEVAVLAAAVGLAQRHYERRTVQRGAPLGWRNIVSQPQSSTFVIGDDEHVARWVNQHGVLSFPDRPDVELVDASTAQVRLATNGVATTYRLVINDAGTVVDVDWPTGHVRLAVKPRFTDPADQVASGSLLAPMPGSVISVSAAVGATVAAGDPILVLEAMKMQHTIAAPHAGIVTDLPVTPGTQVAAGTVLAVVSEGEES